MRDFRDAKAMAYALRDALKAKAIETSHSECLELIAKAFGYDNWNILAAKIEAAVPGDADGHGSAQTEDADTKKATLYCSFCGKSQHEVRALIAGPTVFICDECVELCDDILDRKQDQELLEMLRADEESGNYDFPGAFEHISRMSTEEVTAYVSRCRIATERRQLVLRHLQKSLAAGDKEVFSEGDAVESSGSADRKSDVRQKMLASLEENKMGLKRYENALQVGLTVLASRESSSA